MRVSLLQTATAFGDPQRNFAQVEALVRQTAKAQAPDVLVLPELWNSGFYPRETLHACCDREGERTRALMGGLARELGVNLVAGSVANLEGGKVYNSCFVFSRSGNLVARYDKTHLFTPMGEEAYFTPGDAVVTFPLDGVLCGAIICYDLRFPELARNIALAGAEVLFVVSQWPAPRIDQAKALVQARAIENQMFVVYVNACGRAGETVFGGCSRLVDPFGEVLAQAGAEETTVTGQLPLELVAEMRDAIPVFRDRRPELYGRE